MMDLHPAWRTVKAWPYRDAPLAAFVLVMLAAAAITSHGTFVFYRYILPDELAIAATMVLTIGIPLLELAAVLDRGSRLYYVSGMVVLLLMEAAAQYLQGQAHFADRVRAQFPDPSGVDLATFASHPAGRLLPILYLAILSAVVVYFGYAASARVRDLRERCARTTAETTTIAELRAEGAQQQQTIAQQQQITTHHEHLLAQSRAQSAQLEDVNTQLRQMIAQYETTIAQLRAEGAQLGAPEAIDLIRIAQRLRAAKVPLREAADLIGLPESTLRSRLERASSTNGTHA